MEVTESNSGACLTRACRQIKAIAIVDFDSEVGMVVGETTPKKALTEQEARSIATLSFPESNCSDKEWQHSFFYRFRSTRGCLSNGELRKEQQFLFGYSYYVQRKDSSLPRGYLQKALVVVAPTFSPLYARLARLIATTYLLTNKTASLKVLLFLTCQRNYTKIHCRTFLYTLKPTTNLISAPIIPKYFLLTTT
eukprot:TRINITY_DN12720_c0_g2_i11.p1 TRINITY_DN12720_c0_g2~~TRINITY_DN12720_c0_g2_i11.p1  ORF type:complete len:194 (+),score=29.84 TRINITY_DN12720_c0_g2_i11:151-732(+)